MAIKLPLEPGMVDNETLGKRLKPHIRKLNLTLEQQEQLTRELNYLADVIVDSYIRKKNYGKPKTT